jgi:hypothetical protein
MIGLELKNDWFWVLTNIYPSEIGCWLVLYLVYLIHLCKNILRIQQMQDLFEMVLNILFPR